MKVADGVHLIDGYDMGFKGRTGTYLLQDEHTTLIETGPSPSVPHVLKGLESLGISPQEIENVILTHIHLDHAGGAGLLIRECPNATVYVHKKGLRHLANPSRLEAGARMVYGDHFDELFAPIIPIDEESLSAVSDGERLSIGADRTLTFYDTPGHAKHHIAIHDSLSQGLFIGDTAGIRYHQTEDYGLTFYLPTTSPNQFDPEAMQQSIERFRTIHPERLFFGHFGVSEQPGVALEQVSEWIPIFVEEAKTGNSLQEIERRLLTRVTSYLEDHNIPSDHPVYEILKLDMSVCAMGIGDYLQKQAKQSSPSNQSSQA
ncbi:MBL fold metallo-hydrolase [Halobacillus locisalis]|uniref:MBL fold metallo-hydrolase n=1 Tax=Halobacillus locisalis TaxID=220753 RepID=A0A838CWR1_9BACI|nr:MBL fold metallo-hydrolase [Halobacillus locisalis]MBA2176592.1 MBL fold metallo-hydrolase [Halobacillus locisalis]